MLTLLTAVFARWIKRMQDRAKLRMLLKKDDKILDDIGLRRAEIEAALNLPAQMDPVAEAYQASYRSLILDKRRC